MRWLSERGIDGTITITVTLTVTVGALLAYFWHEHQKRREQTIGTVQEFYRQYGEFTSVWRAWIELFTRAGRDDEKAWPDRLEGESAGRLLNGKPG